MTYYVLVFTYGILLEQCLILMFKRCLILLLVIACVLGM